MNCAGFLNLSLPTEWSTIFLRSVIHSCYVQCRCFGLFYSCYSSQEEKGVTEDRMVGWHHWLSGHEFEQTLGDSEGQQSLACCSPWGHKEPDMTECLNKNNNNCSYTNLLNSQLFHIVSSDWHYRSTAWFLSQCTRLLSLLSSSNEYSGMISLRKVCSILVCKIRCLIKIWKSDVTHTWKTLIFTTFCCYSSVTQSCPTRCNPMDCSMPRFPVLRCLPEFAQIHIH